MSRHRLTDRTVCDEAQLRALLGAPAPVAAAEDAGDVERLTARSRELIEAAPVRLLASFDGDGRCQVSARRGGPGDTRVIDDATLLMSERAGDGHLAGLLNVLQTPHVGVLFVNPEVGDIVAVTGLATITDDPALLVPSAIAGAPPALGILLDIDAVAIHRSEAPAGAALWQVITAVTELSSEMLSEIETQTRDLRPALPDRVALLHRLIERVVPASEQEQLAAAIERAYEVPFEWDREQAPTGDVWHSGGCHCGGVRFEVHAPQIPDIVRCNCSVCSICGFLSLIVPHENFRLLQGEELLVTYTFNTRKAKHTFCKICGTKAFYRPRSHPESVSVNLRCLDRSTLRGVDITDFDGQNWEQRIQELLGS
ncbi:MAG: hypothetical protein Tsb0020_21200 [Haliangiales bacterium]